MDHAPIVRVAQRFAEFDAELCDLMPLEAAAARGSDLTFGPSLQFQWIGRVEHQQPCRDVASHATFAEL